VSALLWLALWLAPPTTPDPCATDPHCAAERARETRELRRRAEYLEALRAFTSAARQAELSAIPMRERKPYGADFQYTTHMPKAAALFGYTLAWPVRLEAFVGAGAYSQRLNDAATRIFEGSHYGVQSRVFFSKSMLAPYANVGLGWSSGTNTVHIKDSSTDEFVSLNASFHAIYLGAGLDLQWEWLHAAAGYHLAWSYYQQVYFPFTHTQLPEQISYFDSFLKDAMHGLSLEVGGRF